jgi:hypothetical protein
VEATCLACGTGFQAGKKIVFCSQCQGQLHGEVESGADACALESENLQSVRNTAVCRLFVGFVMTVCFIPLLLACFCLNLNYLPLHSLSFHSLLTFLLYVLGSTPLFFESNIHSFSWFVNFFLSEEALT